ncbi:unnamed protein product [Lasius platythorax]
MSNQIRFQQDQARQQQEIFKDQARQQQEMFKQVLVALNSSDATSQSRNHTDFYYTSASDQDVNTSNVTQVSVNPSMSSTTLQDF